MLLPTDTSWVFTGKNAEAANGDLVPVDGVGAHWVYYGMPGAIDGGLVPNPMDPGAQFGNREYFSNLDNAALADIGW